MRDPRGPRWGEGRAHPLLLPPGTPLGSHRMSSSPPAARPHRSRLWLCPGRRARCNPGGQGGKVWSKPCTEEGGVSSSSDPPGARRRLGVGGAQGARALGPCPAAPGEGTGLSCDSKQHRQSAQGTQSHPATTPASTPLHFHPTHAGASRAPPSKLSASLFPPNMICAATCLCLR